MPLTTEQIEKLHKAIDLAKEPGGCKYVVSDAPCCVVAQLARLEGVSLETLKRWNRPGDKYDKLPQNFKAIWLAEKDPDAYKIAEIYGIKLLEDLQELWDNSNRDIVNGTRKAMHAKVDAKLVPN